MPNFIDSKITHSETNLMIHEQENIKIQDNNFTGLKDGLDGFDDREENQKEVKSKRKVVKS